ncbi:isochorismatase family protein [Elizabethkingia anophelis]|uniref:isochorismatase family protein n=1 Tax=Elizabethkingia anophelis TaxID=1117645 RepID=UPI003855CFCB
MASQGRCNFFSQGRKRDEISFYVLTKEEEKIVTKHYPNNFRETDLLDCLKSKGINNLVIVGMMTDVCIDSTTRASMDLGFNNSVIRDGYLVSINKIFNGSIFFWL